MTYRALAAALAIAGLLTISFVAPVQAQPYWPNGSRPSSGGM
jgi:hypothetical protein